MLNADTPRNPTPYSLDEDALFQPLISGDAQAERQVRASVADSRSVRVLVTSAFLGAVQAGRCASTVPACWLGRGHCRRRLPSASPLGASAVEVGEQWTVFGSAGVITAAALTTVLPLALARSHS